MKKLYAILIFAFSVSLANAAIIPIQVMASSFSPASVNAICNDTIVWVWGGSGSHTTTSTTIPSCATSWNAPISVSSFSFAITVPCAGTYNYVCSPHSFTGVINVTCPAGVSSLDYNYVSSVYPNPFTARFSIEFLSADMITLYNVIGDEIKTISVRPGQTKAEINAADLREGIYFYCILKEGIVIETRKIVKN